MKNILILQPNSDQSIAIVKFIRKYSRAYYIIAGLVNDPSQYIPSQLYDDKIIFKSIDEIIKNKNNFDIILPSGALSTKNLLSKVEFIKIGNIIFNFNNLEMFNKRAILPIIQRLGISIPQTYERIDDIEEYPVFFKQAYEKGGGIRGIATTYSELYEIDPSEELIYQEYIDSPETYGFGFLSKDGQIITYFIHKELYSIPREGGSGVILEQYHDEKLVTYAKKIISYFNYSGWGLIEFKYCPKRKDFVFMEINAKFWASIEFALLNNPVFFKELFNIFYEPKNVKCIIFLDRLAVYGLKEYLKLSLHFRKCYKIKIIKSLMILAMNMIPYKIKLIKKIL